MSDTTVPEKKKQISLIPATMGTCAWAMDLFGVDRVDSGDWLSPVIVTGCTDDEIALANELIVEQGHQNDLRIEVLPN